MALLRLIRTACPCGWKAPRKLSVEFTGVAYDLEITYDCPECGTRLKVEGQKGGDKAK